MAWASTSGPVEQRRSHCREVARYPRRLLGSSTAATRCPRRDSSRELDIGLGPATADAGEMEGRERLAPSGEDPRALFAPRASQPHPPRQGDSSKPREQGDRQDDEPRCHRVARAVDTPVLGRLGSRDSASERGVQFRSHAENGRGGDRGRGGGSRRHAWGRRALHDRIGTHPRGRGDSKVPTDSGGTHRAQRPH